MTKKIDISFVIPVFNNSKDQLERCIKSLSFTSDFKKEVLLIDDGSTVQNSKIYKKLAARYHLKYFHEVNLGPAVARNLGIRNSKGNYIFFLDADDEINIKNLSKVAFRSNADIVVFNVLCLYDKTNTKKIYGLTTTNKQCFTNNEIYPLMLKDGIWNWACGKLFKRKFLLDHNILFKAKLLEGEDIDFIYNALKYSPTIFYINKVLYIYNLSYITGSNRKYNHPVEYLYGIFNVYNIRNNIIRQSQIKNKNEIWNNICRITINRVFLIYAYLCCKNKYLFNSSNKIFNYYVNKLEINTNLDKRSRFQIFLMKHKNYREIAVFYYYLRNIFNLLKKI